MNGLRVVALLVVLAIVSESTHAQFYWFGRNKVQYTDFDWQVMQTDNFDIYYYSEMQDLAERGAYIAEESFKLLEDKFNHTISNRTPLIFYSSHLHFQETNVTPGFIPEGVGGFFEFIKGRVVIPFNGSLAQFEHVIRHELVHVFMTSKLAQVLRDRRKPADRLPPLWFVEGLAEYWSTEWDTQADMMLRDAVLNDYIVGLSNIERYYGSFLMYKLGQNAVQFIAEEFGGEAVLLLLENFWRSNSFSDVMKETIGLNYREFDERWLYHLKKKYYPLMADSDHPSRISEKIITDGYNATPVFTEINGKPEVYFVGNHTGYTSLFRLNLDEEDPMPTVVIKGERSSIFESVRIFENSIHISRQGILAFVTKSGESDVVHLYDIKSNFRVETLRFNDLVMLNSPNWSPEGTQLVFAGVDINGYRDLYVYTVEDKELYRLTDDIYDDRDPAWSPKGDVIVFSSDRSLYGRHGYYNLFRYEIESGEITALTNGRRNYRSPSWSPDGKWLVFVSDRNGVRNIWSMEMESENPHSLTRLTDFTTGSFDPSWTSDDGLLFTAYERGRFHIRKLNDVSRLLSERTDESIFDTPPSLNGWDIARLRADIEGRITPYKPSYTLDIAQSQISTDPIFGTSGGAILSISDMLGNERYNFLIYNTAQSQDEFLESFNIAISRISLLRRTNFAYGIFHFAGRRYDLTDPDLFFYERMFGGYFALSYPLSHFKRVEFTSSLSHSNKQVFYDITERKALLISTSVSFIHDNSLWGPTGPLDGRRILLSLAYTTDIQYGNVNYYTLMADYRNYYRLGQRSAFASRFQIFYNHGEEARRYFMGGSWDLRGYPRWSLRGQKLWLTSHELRVPFIDQLGVLFPFGGVGFGSIRGAVFFDAGSVWDNEYHQTLGSIGAGLRWNIGGILVLRYDVGKRIEDNFSRLQSGLFHQFFFGWDF
jgi:WD40 repeat protein